MPKENYYSDKEFLEILASPVVTHWTRKAITIHKLKDYYYGVEVKDGLYWITEFYSIFAAKQFYED